ncbi:MAG TPA: C-type lectin domain-containing protein, partial [Polyangiaceae bacterium]|nr:C-type lectin domain-containing protein [Polyangiaceae bacterium]
GAAGRGGGAGAGAGGAAAGVGGAAAGAGGTAGGAGNALCGDGVAEGDEACDSGLPEGNAACNKDCQVVCQTVDGAAFVDPATGHCYVLLGMALSWLDSAARCRDQVAEGGHLIALSSEPEFEFVRRTLLDALSFTGTAWTGANDRASENDFVWENGEPFLLDGWGWNEAENQPGGGTDQNCVASRGDKSFLLHDYACGDDFRPLCERPPPGRSPSDRRRP